MASLRDLRNELAIVTFNIHLVVLFVTANTDFCGSVFETQVDHALLGHVMSEAAVVDEFECQLKCIGNNTCKSFNVHPGSNNANRICELNNKRRQMKPGDFKWKKGSTYYCSVQISCIDGQSHDQNIPRKSGHCHPDYKGQRCQTPKLGWYSHDPAHSCKNIRDAGASRGDGEYWIDPDNSGNPLNVYCDMTTDGGGWLLIYNIVIDGSSTPPVSLAVQTSYRGIRRYSNNNMVISLSAMKELRTHLSFTQLRFHCSKQLTSRTFHVTTTPNSTGEAVVQYFSGQTDIQPASCGSFVKMEDDNSRLAGLCHKWGKENGVFHVGKWGHDQDQNRLYIYPTFTASQFHWLTIPDGSKALCDDAAKDGHGLSSGDFWKIFVR